MSNARFPQSMKRLREKYPKGLLIQARFVTEAGVVIEFEGVDGDGIVERLLASTRTKQEQHVALLRVGVRL